MAINAGPKIEIDDLDFVLDAANPRSYPRNGSNWKGLKRRNNFALTNNPSFNAANGGFFTFDGTDDYVSLGDLSSQLSNVTQYSIGCWFYQNTLDVHAGILGRPSAAGTPSIHTAAQGWMGFSVHNNRRTKGKIDDYSTVISAGEWAHVFMVYNGSLTGNSERLKVFINAKQITLSYVNTIPSSTGTVTQTDFVLGKQHSGLHLHGGISNFKIYKRALSARRIRANYEATVGRYS